MGTSILTALPTPTWQTAAWVVGVFGAAWIVSRLSGRLANWVVRRNEAKHMSGDGPADTGVMTSLKRRETAISLIRTSVRYFAYGAALILALGALSFGGRRRIFEVLEESGLEFVLETGQCPARDAASLTRTVTHGVRRLGRHSAEA